MHCPWCEGEHAEDYLCPPAKAVLDLQIELARTHDVAQREYPTPVGLKGSRPGDAILRQFLVQAGVVPVAGVPRALLVFTGEDANGSPLPRWVFMGGDQEIRGVVKLVEDNANLAISRAVQQRRAQKGKAR